MGESSELRKREREIEREISALLTEAHNGTCDLAAAGNGSGVVPQYKQPKPKPRRAAKAAGQGVPKQVPMTTSRRPRIARVSVAPIRSPLPGQTSFE